MVTKILYCNGGHLFTIGLKIGFCWGSLPEIAFGEVKKGRVYIQATHSASRFKLSHTRTTPHQHFVREVVFVDKITLVAHSVDNAFFQKQMGCAKLSVIGITYSIHHQINNF